MNGESMLENNSIKMMREITEKNEQERYEALCQEL